ncbi:cytochrome D ubiquinol oxidase subunit I [Acetobacter senegalensis]|uniref:Cytochrome D ubiquinol oxidase subunit I n=2 Tax=Acetobacter TaxID=434 RepID=A0A252EK93_9PROT|nr:MULTISPECIES: pyridoxal-dependent decarboxylase [Acetobacter]ATJ91368.1 cytochrome D ubiquinol oxidase subunit I [Acetobacter tropicalis]OUL66819.1 cytochrome D ubiquinol oxidase subunit I [Acetobacter senegalensis]
MAGLDPENWEDLRALGHRMLDDMLDNVKTVAAGPVWQPMPESVRQGFHDVPLPQSGAPVEQLYHQFTQQVLPYAVGNRHPRFMGWVHGGGTPQGMLAEMLAAGLNANLGGRDHAPVEVERMVIRWTASMLGFPETATGVLVTGSSMANFIGVITASRAVPAGVKMRAEGIQSRRLVGYAGQTAHGCIARAFDLAGLGTDALRRVPMDAAFRMDMDALRSMIAEDRAAGFEPFLVVGTAGTVDTGSIDPLADLAAFARDEGLWFHVDGAFGALARLSAEYAPALAGMEQANSIALDFHKWAQTPYDAGCIIVREEGKQAAAFAQSLAYLARENRGLAAGAPWFCDLGPDLSRGFRALKVWFTLAGFGTDGLGEVVTRSCAVARYLAARIDDTPCLELLAPVTLNIVCFRVVVENEDLDTLNGELVKDLHESGIAAPSTTTLHGKRAIRAAIVNHRTTEQDADILLNALLDLAETRTGKTLHRASAETLPA